MKRINLYILAVCIAFAACKNNGDSNRSAQTNAADTTSYLPAIINYQLVNVYPHDPSGFTEGLQFINGNLYESSGEYGISDIRRTDLTTGKILQQHKMEARYFGEGLAVLNGKIYQLTYREHTGFIYDQKTFKPLSTFSFDGVEGWGMTTDGTNLIYDDGTDKLYFMNPSSFKIIRTVNVTDEQGPVQNINELEYIKGYIYANQWRTDNILKIDAASGKVTARADLSGLRQQLGIPAEPVGPKSPEVLNGIAYDSATNRIFVTGKYWPKLAEIRLDN